MDITMLATQLGRILQQHNKMCTTAESCTGGGIAQAITDIPQSSHWFERGFITYSNDAKAELLNVPLELLVEFGSVSEQVAKAMALGALKHSHAQTSVAVTGIAGPDGGSVEKPVGTVWFAWALDEYTVMAEHVLLTGDRALIREKTVHHALQRWVTHLQKSSGSR